MLNIQLQLLYDPSEGATDTIGFWPSTAADKEATEGFDIKEYDHNKLEGSVAMRFAMDMNRAGSAGSAEL